MRHGTRAGLCALAVLAAVGCHDEHVSQAATPAAATVAPEQAAAARRTITKWLECEECVDGELDAVLRLGSVATPSLAATLRGGLSPATRALLQRELATRHTELRAYARSHPEAAIEIDADTWVKHQIATFEARYQAHSAVALGRLGGPAAEQALRDALAGPLRPDVATVVRDALDALGRAGKTKPAGSPP